MHRSRAATLIALVLGAALFAEPGPSFAQRRRPAPDDDAGVGAAVGAAVLGGIVGGILAAERGRRGSQAVVRGFGLDGVADAVGRKDSGGKGGRPGKRHQGR